MGSMQSPVQRIDRMEFRKIPSKPVKGTFVQIDGVMVIKGDKGALYTNASPLNRKAWCAGVWRWSDAMTACLDSLGLLTPEDKKRHQEWVTELQRQDNVVAMLGEAKRLGEREKTSGVSVKVDNKKLIELWESLPPNKQRYAKQYGYMPPGAQLKPESPRT